jgi:hypothetical protein
MESTILKGSPYYTVDKGENTNPGMKGYGPSDQGLIKSFPGSPILGDMKVLSREEREVTMPQLLTKGHVKNAGPKGTCDPEIEGITEGFDIATEAAALMAYGPTPGFLIGAGVPPVGSDGTNIFNRDYSQNVHPVAASLFTSPTIVNVSDAPHVHGPNLKSPESIGSLIDNFHDKKPMSKPMIDEMTEKIIKTSPGWIEVDDSGNIMNEVAKSSMIMDESAGVKILGFSSEINAEKNAAKAAATSGGTGTPSP